MGVTRLKRKEAKNRTRMQVRVKTIKRLNTLNNRKSPFKGESGIVLEEQQ